MSSPVASNLPQAGRSDAALRRESVVSFQRSPFPDRFGEGGAPALMRWFAFATVSRRRDRRAARFQWTGARADQHAARDASAGDRGLAAIPGSEHLFAASMTTAATRGGLACRRIHVMAGVLPVITDAMTRQRYCAR
jgi:hydroxypyruvate isomerase